MANKLKGEVVIVLGERERTFRFNSNAMAEIEGQLGRSAMSVLQDLEQAERAPMWHTVRVCLFAALREAQSSNRRVVTIDKVGRAMNFEEMPGYLEGCARGILAAYGQDFDEMQEQGAGLDPLGDQEGEAQPDPLNESTPSTSKISENEQQLPA